MACAIFTEQIPNVWELRKEQFKTAPVHFAVAIYSKYQGPSGETMSGWVVSQEQSLYQFKSHLSNTVLQAFRFLPKKDRSEYELAAALMKKKVYICGYRRALWNWIS